MCEIAEPDECCDVWDERLRTARKPHECTACGIKIKPGEKYTILSTLADGYWDHENCCLACDVIRDEFEESHHMIPAPSGLVEALEHCIEEGDEKSEQLWKPRLEAIQSRSEVKTLEGTK